MKKRTPKTNSSKAATRPRVRENGVKDIKSRTPLCAENVIGALRIVCGHRSHILKSFKACVRILTSSIAASSRIFYYYRTRPGYIRVQFEYSYLRSISPQVLVAFIPCLHRAQLKKWVLDAKSGCLPSTSESIDVAMMVGFAGSTLPS